MNELEQAITAFTSVATGILIIVLYIRFRKFEGDKR